MPHPKIENRTPFAFEPLFIADEDGRPLLVPIVKATYRITKKGLVLAEEQVPVNFAGEWWGEPGKSSYKYEPETALPKPATDIVLIGHAYAPGGRATEVDVTLRVGSIEKVVRVFGDRRWKNGLTGASMTKPEPFERIPLIYERAFGGWDRTNEDPKKHGYEPRNPVGVGYHSKHGKLPDDAKLPNLEDPRHLIKRPYDTPPPAGFGFISPDWKPRCDYTGTYDAAWETTRRPLLPRDFDRRFFNAAHPDLTSTEYLRGDEPVLLTNMTPAGTSEFTLPAVPTARCNVAVRDGSEGDLLVNLDTIIINADEALLLLIWRGQRQLRYGPVETASLTLDVEETATHVR
jgi:hypothetical protein